MQIDFIDLPSPSKLITTMDKHRFGASLFVIALLILCVAAVVAVWLYRR